MPEDKKPAETIPTGITTVFTDQGQVRIIKTGNGTIYTTKGW